MHIVYQLPVSNRSKNTDTDEMLNYMAAGNDINRILHSTELNVMKVNTDEKGAMATGCMLHLISPTALFTDSNAKFRDFRVHS